MLIHKQLAYILIVTLKVKFEIEFFTDYDHETKLNV